MWRRRFLHTVVGIAACLLLATPYRTEAYDYSYARVVRLSLVQGEVQIARADQQGWENAVANMPIRQGDTLATNNGRAEIEFESGATAQIAENTVLQFTELALSNGGRITKLNLSQGTATFYAHLSSDDSFIIATPRVQVTIPKRAEVRIDVFNDGSSVSVFQGEASVDTPAGLREISKGQTLAFSAAAPDEVRIERNPSPDAWDRWVDGRENFITTASAQSSQYTSAPFSYGMADMANYGNWNYYSGYGYGWQPWGLYAGWAPFWNGRWAFYPGLGWTWISYEQWGWVPYHYGRWVYSPVYGWLWLPGGYNYWCPGPVQWVQVGNQVGWRPLGVIAQPGGNPHPPAPPRGPIVVGSLAGEGNGTGNKILNGDNLGRKLHVRPEPPEFDGKFIGKSAKAANGTHDGSKAAPVAGAAALQAGSSTLVPAVPLPSSVPGPASMRSSIVFDLVEHRYVNIAPAPAAPPAPVKMPAITPGAASAPSAMLPPPAAGTPPKMGVPSAAATSSTGVTHVPPAPPRMEIHRPSPPPPPPPHAQPSRPAPPPRASFSGSSSSPHSSATVPPSHSSDGHRR